MSAFRHPLSRLYVVGGREARPGPRMGGLHRYDRGVILRVDVRRRRASVAFEYVSPPAARATDGAFTVFKAGTLVDGLLYACTETEVLILETAQFRTVGYVTLPWFNDVHHVRPTRRGTLMVASTGLDTVLEVSGDGTVLNRWSVLGPEWRGDYSAGVDYRRVVTTTTRSSHPNYVFLIDDEPWVTRFRQRDAVCLVDRSHRIDIGGHGPHDGVVWRNRVYFTTVEGRIVVADTGSGRVVEAIDLNEIPNGWDPRLELGWCRALHVVDERHVVVGFTRLRSTKLRANVRWVKHSLGMRDSIGAAPTRIALYDIRQGQLHWELPLEDAGLHAVFSIHAGAP
jgi:hypothetical protein